MPSKQNEYEQAYDSVETISIPDEYTLSDDNLTIDLSDFDITDNFTVTHMPGVGNLPGDFTVNTANTITTDWNWGSDITLINPWEEFCEYVGLDKGQNIDALKIMCKRYPALQKSLEQFANTYNIVKDDYQTERKDI